MVVLLGRQPDRRTTRGASRDDGNDGVNRGIELEDEREPRRWNEGERNGGEPERERTLIPRIAGVAIAAPCELDP